MVSSGWLVRGGSPLRLVLLLPEIRVAIVLVRRRVVRDGCIKLVHKWIIAANIPIVPAEYIWVLFFHTA